MKVVNNSSLLHVAAPNGFKMTLKDENDIWELAAIAGQAFSESRTNRTFQALNMDVTSMNAQSVVHFLHQLVR